MVDKAKRNTLKNVVGIGVGAVSVAVAPNALATLNANLNNAQALRSSALGNELADIQVSSRISSTTNDLEVVLTNAGGAPTTITDMTPSEIKTVRGRFDFDALFINGDVNLAAGESVTVPMKHHAVVLYGSDLGKRTLDLTAALRQNVSIVTNGDSLAAVTIANPLSLV